GGRPRGRPGRWVQRLRTRRVRRGGCGTGSVGPVRAAYLDGRCGRSFGPAVPYRALVGSKEHIEGGVAARSRAGRTRRLFSSLLLGCGQLREGTSSPLSSPWSESLSLPPLSPSPESSSSSEPSSSSSSLGEAEGSQFSSWPGRGRSSSLWSSVGRCRLWYSSSGGQDAVVSRSSSSEVSSSSPSGEGRSPSGSSLRSGCVVPWPESVGGSGAATPPPFPCPFWVPGV